MALFYQGYFRLRLFHLCGLKRLPRRSRMAMRSRFPATGTGVRPSGAGKVRVLGGDGCGHGQKYLRIPSVRLRFLLFRCLRPARIWF